MKPSDMLNLHRQNIRDLVAQSHARNPRVFGSVLYGDDSEASDLDLLVDALPGMTLLELGGLQAELEELLGVPVDVLTPDDIPAKFRQKVLREALPV